MTEKLQQTIKVEVAKLPAEAREAINALDWPKLAEEIGHKHFLTEEEINNFQVETLLLLTGLNDPEFYATSIENEVGTTKNDAAQIAEEAFEKIFTPIENAIEEKVKKNLKNKNPEWDQNLDFIISGGEYSTLIEKMNGAVVEASKITAPDKTPTTPVNPPSLADIQARVQKTNNPANTDKAGSLRSKLVI